MSFKLKDNAESDAFRATIAAFEKLISTFREEAVLARMELSAVKKELDRSTSKVVILEAQLAASRQALAGSLAREQRGQLAISAADRVLYRLVSLLPFSLSTSVRAALDGLQSALSRRTDIETLNALGRS